MLLGNGPKYICADAPAGGVQSVTVLYKEARLTALWSRMVRRSLKLIQSIEEWLGRRPGFAVLNAPETLAIQGF
jgi:hypothetical protein